MQEACRYSVARSRRRRQVGKVSFYISSPCRPCSSPLQVSQPKARHRLYIHVFTFYCGFSRQNFLRWCEVGIMDSLCGYGSTRLLGTSTWLPCPPQGANWQKVTVLSQSKYMSVPSQCMGAILNASIEKWISQKIAQNAGVRGSLGGLKIEIRLLWKRFMKLDCQHTWLLTKMLRNINSFKYYGRNNQFGGGSVCKFTDCFLWQFLPWTDMLNSALAWEWKWKSLRQIN